MFDLRVGIIISLSFLVGLLIVIGAIEMVQIFFGSIEKTTVFMVYPFTVGFCMWFFFKISEDFKLLVENK